MRQENARSTILTAALAAVHAIFLARAASAGVPIRWTVETSRFQPVQIDAVHGEEIALAADLQSYGRPFDMTGRICALYWQTNGMGAAWWTAPAVVASNRIEATFAPTMDPGAATVTGFLGAPGEIYRAAFVIRFRRGPGATPNALPLPTPTIDCGKVTFLNPDAAPFAPLEEIETYDGEIVKAIDAQHVYWLPEGKRIHDRLSYLLDEKFNNLDDTVSDLSSTVGWHDELITYLDEYKAHKATTLEGYGITDAYPLDDGTRLASEVAGIGDSIETLNVGYARLYGFATGATNANFTATNYPPTKAEADARCHYHAEPGMDFSTVPASLQLNEFRDGEWRTVMDTRDWTVWYFRFKETQLTNQIARLAAENAALSNRLESAQAWADRTANGVANPMKDTVVVDRPNMWLMADYEWSKVVRGTNACFVIRSKNFAASVGANAGGFLEICDAFGKPYMRINKGADVPADPIVESIEFDEAEGAWYIVYKNSTKPRRGGANLMLEGRGNGKALLIPEDDENCPAVITWPDVPESVAGHWIMKAVPKQPQSVMFFGAEVIAPGSNYVEYLNELSFGAGIRVNGNVYDPVESGDTLVWRKRQ